MSGANLGTTGINLTGRWSRFSPIIVVAAVVVAITGLLLPTTVLVWAPVLHWTCQSQSEVYSATDAWLPVVFVNSPFGGTASGTGWMPWTFPGAGNGPPPGPGAKVSWGTSAHNGTAYGAFFEVSMGVYQVRNVIALGPGANNKCSAPTQLELLPPAQYGGTATPITLPGNLSDAGEASNATLFLGSADPVKSPVIFNNSFTTSNSPDISTCGVGGKTFTVDTRGLRVQIMLNISGATELFPYDFPFSSELNYSFPANFGTWAIDNLSAPGGPSGGWAFSYSPCS
jgi:hypothetical protein